jgi:hypothetical protein
MLAGFSRKKRQSLLMKAFNLIKSAPFAAIRPHPNSDRKANGATQRSYLNTTFSNSEHSPPKLTALKNLRPNKVENDENTLGKGHAERSFTKLEQLLSRIKSVNSGEPQRVKTERGPIRDSATLCMETSRLKPTSMGEMLLHHSSFHNHGYFAGNQTSAKSSRRQFIMEKFRHIESSLSELRQGEDPNEAIGSEILNEIHTLREKLNFRAKNTFNPFKA